jgi:hypothetical protein
MIKFTINWINEISERHYNIWDVEIAHGCTPMIMNNSPSIHPHMRDVFLIFWIDNVWCYPCTTGTGLHIWFTPEWPHFGTDRVMAHHSQISIHYRNGPTHVFLAVKMHSYQNLCPTMCSTWLKSNLHDLWYPK